MARKARCRSEVTIVMSLDTQYVKGRTQRNVPQGIRHSHQHRRCNRRRRAPGLAGGLLTWGHSFVNSNVRTQLAQQQISFPPQAAFAHPKAGTEITPSMIPAVSQYAGQQLLTGAQAQVYANDFIAVHLSEMPCRRGLFEDQRGRDQKQPTNAKLTALKQTSFQGTTLREVAARGVRVLGDRCRDAVGAIASRSSRLRSWRSSSGLGSGTRGGPSVTSRCWSRR